MNWDALRFLAVHDLRLLLRQREVLLWAFLMPIVFIVFFGTMSSVVHPRRSGSLRFAIEGNHDGPLARALAQRLRDLGADVDGADFDRADGADGAEESGGPRRVISLPDDFEARMAAGASLTAELLLTADGLTASQDVFVARAAFGLLATDLAGRTARRDPLRLDITSAGPPRPTPFGLRQTVPGILLALVLVNILTSGAVLLVGERREGLLVRLVSAPVSRATIVLGKSGSRFLLALFTLFVGLAGARLLFAEEFATLIDSSAELAAVAIVLILFSAMCAAAAILLGSLARTEAQAITIGVLSSNALAALGGCWFPIGLAPAPMFKLSALLPTRWAIDAIQRATRARDDEARVVFDAIWGAEVGGLLVVTLLLFYFATRSFRFR